MTPETNTRAAPLVSVIVPAYNYGHFLSQTLENLQSQTYRNWECIVVDDGSADNTREVVAARADADERIRYVRQENQGLGASRNTGLSAARGDYYQFLDADDMLEARKFELQVGYMESRPEVDIVYGGVRYFTTENPSERLHSMWGTNESWMPGVSGTTEVLLALLSQNIMVVNSPLLRRSVIESVGVFDGGPVGLEDWDYWIRCAAAGKRFEHRDEEGARALVRSHPTSMSRDERLMRRSMVMVRRKTLRADIPAEARRLNRRLLIKEAGELGVLEISQGNLKGGVRQLFVAGLASERLTTKLRWMTCACLSPFVRGEDFPKMVTLPFPQLCGFILRRRRNPFSGRTHNL